MRIHEYQGKDILRRFSIPVPFGITISSNGELSNTKENLVRFPVIIKAQIHAGGRGEAGGIKIAKDMKELKAFSNEMLGMKLITKQTNGEGKTIRTLLIEESIEKNKEFYLGILVDRNSQKIVLMASEDGGVNIEKNKQSNPKSIRKILIDPCDGLTKNLLKQLTEFLNINDQETIKKFNVIAIQLYEAFNNLDATLAEINPLALTKKNEFIALDSKWDFDSNALPRQPEIFALRDSKEVDPLELESMLINLAYIKLDGNIGCMVNGAGLAMATMDIIKLLGGVPANFLDVGGGAAVEKVAKAFEIMSSHPRINVGFINIFGGIMRCDHVALGVVKGLSCSEKLFPLVVRMKGFKEVEAHKILKSSNFGVEIINSFDIAAKRAVELSKQQ